MKSPYLAAVDIGNSGMRIGLLKGGRLLASSRLAQAPRSAASALRRLLAEAAVKAVDGFVISSVVPRQTEAVRSVLRRATGRAGLVIAPGMKTGLRMRYRTPETLGADRLCAATAAFARYGGPVIVVDLGTATTVDCVTRTGEYLGGAISPGIETSARALHARAAQLPMIDLVLPEQIVGRDTRSSLQTGVILGAIAAMEGLVGKFRRSAGLGATVVATGGFAPLVATQSRVLDIINPHLVLEGAALIWMKHRGGIKRTG